MELFYRYLSHYFISIFCMLGMLLLSFTGRGMVKKFVGSMRLLVATVVVLSITEFLERYYGDSNYFTSPVWQRTFYSAINYTIRPLILLELLSIVVKNRKLHITLAVIEVLDFFAAFSAFYTKIFYSFSETNHFDRGPLGYFFHVVSIGFAGVILYYTVKSYIRHNFIQGTILGLMVVFGFLALYLEGVNYDIFIGSYTGVLAINGTLFFTYCYIEASQKDSLTELYNRNFYDEELKASYHHITAVISLDLNGLKQINDTKGHLEGDKALHAVAQAILKSLNYKADAYRTGGDEFMILCNDMKDDKVLALVNRLEKNLASCGYSCAYGVSYRRQGTDINKAINESDEIMYAKKKEMKRKEFFLQN